MDNLTIALLFLLGACLGSFAGATVFNYINKRKILKPRSSCPICMHKLSWWEMIPILSFVLLRGKCHSCKQPISTLYFYIECLCGIIALLLARNNYDLLSVIINLFIINILIIISAIDIKTYIIPDILILCLLIAIPFHGFVNNLLLYDILIGMIFAAIVPACLYLLFKKFRQIDAIGMGDIKLFSIAGGLCGYQALPFIFLFASVAGIIVILFITFVNNSHKQIWTKKLQFGPCISAVTVAVLIWNDLPLRFYQLLNP